MPVKRSILERFVVLEGLDGSGTSTQMRLLASRLEAEGRPHRITWEPTGEAVGSLIRSILARAVPALPRTIAMLYAADRNEHVHAPEGILAWAAHGDLVISDRYIFSSLAYQSIECGFDYVFSLNEAFPLPVCLFFIDTPVEVCQTRLARRGMSELFDGSEFQSRVREAYLRTLDCFRGSGMRISALEGNRPPAEIHEDIWKVLSALPIT
jgi:dTMP kinase